MQNTVRVWSKCVLGWLSGVGCALWERKEGYSVFFSCWKEWGKFNSIPPMGHLCDHPKWLVAKFLWELLEFFVSLVPNWMYFLPLTKQGKNFSTENPPEKEFVVLRQIGVKQTSLGRNQRDVFMLAVHSTVPHDQVQGHFTQCWNWDHYI